MSETLDQTSSISAVWPPEPGMSNRLRGFYNKVVDTPEAAKDFLREFEHYLGVMQDSSELDRLSIRAVASRDALQLFDTAGVQIEGGLPLRGSDEMIVYTAWNAAHRSVPEQRLYMHRTTLGEVVQHPRDERAPRNQSADTLKPRLVDTNMSIETRQTMVEAFSDLYRVFGYDEADVEEILSNPQNTIAYLEDAQGVVSTAMAERGIVEIENRAPITLVEITEAVTRPEARGQGHYRTISRFLVDYLAHTEGQGIDVIYGESNLAMRGVLIAAHQNGRRFSHFDREQLGVRQPHFGILQQNVHVEDGAEIRTYNDFALSYIPIS